MKCRIKITSCSNPNLWYVDRIGQEFDVEVVGGRCSVEGNPIFKIKGADYEVVKDYMWKPKKKTKYSTVLSMIEENESTVDEIHHKYISKYGYESYAAIESVVYYLLNRLKQIEKTGKKRRSGYNTEQLRDVYRVKKINLERNNTIP